MASAREFADDLKFDVDRLPLPGAARASDDALAVLDRVDERTTVARATAYARGEGGRVGIGDLLRTLQHADGQLALVTWANTGIEAVGYRPAEQRFDVGGFSAVREMMGDEAEYYERCTRAAAKDVLTNTQPDIVTRAEADLLPALDGGGRDE